MTGFLMLTVLALAATFIAPVKAGAGMINLAGFFIGIMGMLLDLSLKFLVVQFDTQIYGAIAEKLGQVWTAFRDMANIAIIGMFTFIAISTILGVESFGARKLIARVLIIAVLINFSLLFTRIIIGSSNFVASKFYTAMSLDSIVETAAANGATPGILNYASTAGISGQFINLLGLPSALNASETVESIYDANAGWQYYFSTAGGVMAIIYGFTAASLMVATGLVLAYAVFLLVARTVLFIFLMVMSALAFASYLIPHWGDKFWSLWWGSLLRNAIFAPLLMLMLWATLIISYALVSGVGQTRSFDKLFSDPTSGSGALALLVFLIILGMLYGCVRFASSFSTKIAGFNWAATIPAFGFGALARIGGVLSRQGIGRPALNISERLQNKAATSDNPFAKRMYDLGAQQFKGMAQKDFVARGQLGSMLAKTAGMKVDKLMGAKLGGFEGTQKAFLKRIGEQADRMKPSKEQKAKGQEEAFNQALRADPELAQKHAEAEKEHEERKAQHSSAEADYTATVKRHEQAMKDLREAIAAGDDTARDAAQNRVDAEQASMRRESDRIKTAKTLSDKAQRGLKEAQSGTMKAAEASGRMKWAFQKTGDIAEELTKTSLTSLLYASGISKESRDELAKKANKDASKHEKQHHFKEEYGEAFKAMMKEGESKKEGGEEKDH